MYDYADSSKTRLKAVHPDLQLIMTTVKKYCTIDFDISCGARTTEEQQAAYFAGNSELDGIHKMSKHQLIPSEAVDIYAYKEGGKASYTYHQLSYIAGVIQAVAIMLYSVGKTKHIIRWGGNWDQDGYIIDDQTFQDLGHFEIVEV